MSTDYPADLPTVPEPGRRRFTIRALALAVVVAAVWLGLYANLDRFHRRVKSAGLKTIALNNQIRMDNPSIPPVDVEKLVIWYRPWGGGVDGQYRLMLPSRREITITAEFRSSLFGEGPNRVTFASGGRSVTWPFEDLDRDRKVDLHAMFPEAFR